MKKLHGLIPLILFLAYGIASAQSTPVVAVIGDSLSHEYRCVNRGSATAYNWVESLARVRGVNFGAINASNCYVFDYAYSGYTVMNQMQNMVTSTISAFSKGNITRVIIFLGSNDISNGTSPATIESTYSTQVQRLITAGVPAADILIMAVPQQDCASSSWNANITDLNTRLSNIATTKGAAFAPYSAYCALLNTYNGGNPNTSTYSYGGQSISRYSWCNTYCLKIPDGHPGTVALAIMANAMVAPWLGIAPMTEAEVLALMGIGTSPTHTPSITPSPTATRTPTPTPTATLTFTPTNTPAPFVLDCGAGWHWVTMTPNDPQRVQCVLN